MEAPIDDSNYLPHPQHSSQIHRQHENENENEKFIFPPPPQHSSQIHRQHENENENFIFPPPQQNFYPSNLPLNLDKTAYIVIFVSFILGFFMGKTMQPVILRPM
jgi:hypothetical protein